MAQNTLSERDLDNLQWAKEFMEKYERKHKIKNGDGKGNQTVD